MSDGRVTGGAEVTAVVYAADGVRFVAAGACPSVIAARVAEYVSARCDNVMWPDAAIQIRALLDRGEIYGAIALYFERVGERWDEERLEFVGVGDVRP